jgi:glutamyl-tRNA reductase
MTLIALGLNHQTAPVALRERVAFDRETVPPALAALRGVDGIEEVAILSTCNRIELYAKVREGHETAVVEWLHSHHGLTPPTLTEFLYRHDGPAAVRHLFRVATGLDSLVLGEPQILGQVKEAYHLARGAGTLSSSLDRLFQNTFAVAKRVRTDTRIGANPVSVAFAAVRLAHQVFADLGKSTVLLVGAGDTIELTARHLAESGIHRMLVANRTVANAEALATRFGAQAMSLAEIPQRLAEADVVICSTASREPILTREQVAAAIRARRRKPMLILDLAVPRDVEASTAELNHVFLYTVDDLAGVIEENMRSRREAAREAEAIIDLQVGHFMDWCRGLEGQGLVRSVRAQAEHERDVVLGRARQMLAAGKPADEALAFLANTLTNKLMHAPSANLRAAALRGDTEMLRAAEKLYSEAADARPPRDE